MDDHIAITPLEFGSVAVLDDIRTAPPRVVVVTNSPALRAGLIAMLSRDEQVRILSDDESGADIAPDVVVLDAAAVRLLEDFVSEQWPRANILLIGEPPADELQDTGDRVVGAVSADIEGARLVAAVIAIAHGLVVIDPALEANIRHGGQAGGSMAPVTENGLTPRERQVLDLVARGYPNKSIAYELGISEHTAKFHVGSLLNKLDAASRAEVVTNATRRGWLTV